MNAIAYNFLYSRELPTAKSSFALTSNSLIIVEEDEKLTGQGF
jgi:hypothetical protein